MLLLMILVQNLSGLEERGVNVRAGACPCGVALLPSALCEPSS